MGPLYKRSDFLLEYWIWRRAFRCSTGAAMKLTVAPAITPAIPWPREGSLWICEGSGRAKLDGVAAMRSGENSVRWRSLR